MKSETMKKLLCFFALILITATNVFSNGVAVYNAQTGSYLKLLRTETSVSVEIQVGQVVTTQTFQNLSGADRLTSFAFPLPEGASATGLRWKVNGIWYVASITSQPQDSTLPGGGTITPNLKTYLGKTPLIFAIPQQVKKDSTLIVELSYVQFLTYDLGNVEFNFKGDYRLIQSTSILFQQMEFTLTSPRTIDSIRLVSTHPLIVLTNNGHNAYVLSQIETGVADKDYKIRYSLNQTQLGLYSFSSRIPDSQLPDSLGGFFMFLAEPDAGTSTQTIKKVFTLILDKSGSMLGTKIQQAKDAANFIVNNLNPGDKFNIVDFETNVYSFRSQHVSYTPQSRDSALAYINNIVANGSTNISGAFSTAVPQFAVANDSTANIIIFFTDGQPTVGITDITQLTAHIHNLIVSNESKIFLFSFGIGTDVNQQLLTLISAQNNGLSQFLLDTELYSSISSFYLHIRNPVLLNTQIAFNPNNVTEVYPSPLPNLYKGQQMIVTGRYLQTGNVNVTLSGTAFNHPVSYPYSFNRSDTAVQQYQFLTKIWAKQKIENLLIQYYALNPISPAAIAIKNKIIQISQQYGVISPFTSFGSGITSITGPKETVNELLPGAYGLIGNYPNPFNPTTNIKFYVNANLHKIISIKIYNSLGQLIKIMQVNVNGRGEYEVQWNALDEPSGLYFYLIDFGDQKFAGKMMLVK
ncbi:hypothetical protein BH10BAC5_BH10BAC5_28200 [soil metagenome]